LIRTIFISLQSNSFTILHFQGGKIIIGRYAIESEGNFIQPTNVEVSSSAPVVKEELFGLVLYVMKFQVAYSPIP
jgi:aldehyde dehydrogenase family 7 member A1